MSHIFGIAHSFSGIVDQVGGLFGVGNGIDASGFSANRPVVNEFLTSPGVVDDTFGGGTGRVATTGGSCGPCGPKTKRFITTVCPDGTTTIREAKSRKRRRRLASMGDIKDLAALKNILGGGKAFDTWIATRGR